MDKIHNLASELNGGIGCCICFHKKQVGPKHWTFHCSVGTCASQDFKAFKKNRFQKDASICFFCFAPFGDPWHKSQSEKPSPTDCRFPDKLKELAYIIYNDQDTRRAVFGRLGRPVPLIIDSYKLYISRRVAGGLLGVYEVLNAYIDVRNS